ncbi:hypothetical protein NP233_g11008 [Leucocoprinus birnbaumii]|uniref:Uncharacterized protein n=1 Tax=Leucocoprinus birnbaumii TaxID=56174 RepID=A0AAD5YKT5_9AGAR|nr:hypothetical protein NP233_g11008 [Leucocoprinus birnbaumii]
MESSHIYTLFLSIDGNFCIQRKRKDDPNDKALGVGRGYFVENDAFKAYFKDLEGLTHDEARESLCSPVTRGPDDYTGLLCSQLKDVRQQDRIKFRDAVISGILATQCARHQFYMGQGMVDLEKGESYARTDYALAHALGEEAKKQSWIMMTYDIWCQYSKLGLEDQQGSDIDRNTLFKRLCTWRSQQLERFLKLGRPQGIDIDDDFFEVELRLPSSNSPDRRIELDLVDAAVAEGELRRGYAYDLIYHLRDKTHEYNGEIHFKKVSIRSQRDNTRSLLELQEINAEHLSIMAEYK